MSAEYSHLVCIRDFCSAEIEALVIAVSENVHGVILRIRIGVEVILNLAHGVPAGVDFENLASVADLGECKILVRHIAVDDDKLVSALFRRKRKRGGRFLQRGVNRDVFPDFRMDDRIMEREIRLVRRNFKIKTGVQDEFAVFRKMTLKNIRIKFRIPDDFDGIVFRIAGFKEGVDLFGGVGIIVKHENLGVSGKQVPVEVLGGFGIKYQKVTGVGSVGSEGIGVICAIGRGRCVGRVRLFTEICIKEAGKGSGECVVLVGDVNGNGSSIRKNLSRILRIGFFLGKPASEFLNGPAGFIHADRTGIFCNGLRLFFLTLRFGYLILMVGI